MPLGAHNNNYPFDYDPAQSEDPTGIANDLHELHNRLPGLPDGLVEIEMAGIAFNYYPETLDMIQRARDSGPAFASPIERIAQRCAAHEVFGLPSFLLEPASSDCQVAAQVVNAAFDGSFKTCQEVEFPEVFVFDQPPAVVDANFLGQSELLSTLEGQIGLIGEALSHLDYPAGLIPESFWPLARNVIAKIRHQKLSDNIDTRLVLYHQAKQRLQSSASCFDSAASASLQTSIDALVVELTAVGQYLDQLYRDGLAQAARDRLAVESQGRLRNDLEQPALTDHEREMLAFYLTAVYWRVRGGGLIRNPANGTIPDITYVVNIFEGIAEFTGGLAEPEAVGNRYAIDESYGYQEWWDMGNEPGHDQYYDLLWMTDRGRRGVNLVGALLGDLGFDIRHLVAGGLMMGPCYYYMWYELWARNGRYFRLGENLVDPYYTFLEMPVSSGEVCYGGAMGLGLARTLLWGRPDPGCQASCSGLVCGSDGCGGSCGSCAAPEICSSAGRCVEPGSDAGIEPVDATVAAQDVVSGTDAAQADDAETPADGAAGGDRGGDDPDAAVTTADAGRADSSSSGDVNEPSNPGCDDCSLTYSHHRSAHGLIVIGMLFFALRRRRN